MRKQLMNDKNYRFEKVTFIVFSDMNGLILIIYEVFFKATIWVSSEGHVLLF